jgi:hypothetical protein
LPVAAVEHDKTDAGEYERQGATTHAVNHPAMVRRLKSVRLPRGGCVDAL